MIWSGHFHSGLTSSTPPPPLLHAHTHTHTIALVTGKSLAIDPKTVRMNSLSVGWSDSDSSIDSMPESEEEQEEEDDPEGDWPKHTGYHVSLSVA